MGLFDFLKPKKPTENNAIDQMLKSFFPKGKTDINSATNELLFILDNKISGEEAKNTVLKSIAISRVSKNFDKQRLTTHLAGYCIHHFNESQIDKFYNYLIALSAGMLINNKSPSEIKRDGDVYFW